MFDLVDEILNVVFYLTNNLTQFTSVDVTNEIRKQFPLEDIPNHKVAKILREEFNWSINHDYKVINFKLKSGKFTKLYLPLIHDITYSNEDKELIYTWDVKPPQSIAVDIKCCKKCGRVLPIDSFHKDSTRPDGHKYVCKECRRTLGY